MVTRNGRFRVSKGYSRQTVKRDTTRLAEEDYYRERALRRLSWRDTVAPPLPRGEGFRRLEARAVEPLPLPADQPVQEERPVRLPDAVTPPPVPAAPAAPPRPRRRQRLRQRYSSEPGFWARLWRALLGHR